MTDGDAPMVDVVFDIAGTTLPAEHAYELWRATVHWLPWLEAEALSGIHRLRTAPTGYGEALLARRAKLALRVPERRIGHTLALSGRTLDVDGRTLAVGAGAARPLRPWPTLHARQVAAATVGEAAFQDEVAASLRAREVACQFITGRRQIVMAGSREVVGFSVVLHGLTRDDSLRVQFAGMGGDRGLGCGIFVPYKSIAAVG
jgi:CRISPR-associated protein Cas6